MDFSSFLPGLLSGGAISLLTHFFLVVKYKEKVDQLEKLYIPLVKSNVDTLLEFKIWATKFIDSQLFNAKSPLSLTKEGLELIRDSGFESIFEKVKDDLAEKLLKQKNPKTQYDVQEYARGFMDDMSREEYKDFLPLKKYAFENGKDYAQILRAGSILLRGYYLCVHPEINN